MQFRIDRYIFTLLLIVSISYGYSQTVPSKHYTTVDGLPNNAIQSIYKDSNGIMWIGTKSGLCRFDGKELKTYTQDDGLVGNNIWAIVEDHNKNLWLSCYGDGLSKFDGENFTNYTTENGITDNRIRTLKHTKTNHLLIGTENGLTIFKNGEFSNYKKKIKKNKTDDWRHLFQVMQFFEKDNEQYLLSRTHGFHKINLNTNKVSIDSLTSQGWGFKYIHLNKRELYSEAYTLTQNNIKNNFKSVYTSSSKLSNDIIWDYQKTGNDVYIASWGVNNSIGGLLKWDGYNITDLTRRYGIESTKIWSLYYDNASNKLWIGTLDNGVYVIDLSENITYISAKDFNTDKLDVVAIEFLNDTKWVLTKYGLLNTSNNKFLTDNYFNTQLTKPSSAPIEYRGLKVFNNHLFLNTDSALFKISDTGVALEILQTKSSAFVVLKNGTLLSSYPYGYFNEYPNFNKNIDYKTYHPSDKNTPSNITDAIISNNKSYFTTEFEGLFVYSNGKPISLYKKGVFKEKHLKYLRANNNKLYITTNSGKIFIADVKNDFKLIDSIPKKKIIGTGIDFLEIFNNTILVGTNKGLNIIKNNTIQLIDNEQGLTHRNFTSSKINNDSLYIGTKNGLYNIYLPKIINAEKNIPQVNIKSIKVNHHKINNELFSTGKYIELPYHKNSLEVTLSDKELYTPNKIITRFKLNNSDWNNISNNKIILPNLSSDSYKLKIEVTDLTTGKITTTELLTIIIDKPYWRTWWFWLLIASVLIALTVVLYNYNINKIKKREAIKSQLTKRITETKLEALQSQMNPHFTFNAMSSIQNYIIDNDIDNALMYMGEFSKLIRQTLDNSSEHYISLDEEIDYLTRYAKLENMRFDNSVSISINHNNLSIFDEEIPPMLIQPLVENSFNHAFIDTNKEHKLTITFSKENNFIKCIVNDNGVGLNNQTSTINHTSKGLRIIKERLGLLQQYQSEKLVTVNSSSNGTITTILIPVKNIN